MAGKILLPGVSVWVFLEGLTLESAELSTEDHPHQCGWASSNLFRASLEQKGRERANPFSA